MPSARALSQTRAKPSGRETDEFNSDDIEVVYLEEVPDVATTEVLEAKSDAGLHP